MFSPFAAQHRTALNVALACSTMRRDELWGKRRLDGMWRAASWTLNHTDKTYKFSVECQMKITQLSTVNWFSKISLCARVNLHKGLILYEIHFNSPQCTRSTNSLYIDLFCSRDRENEIRSEVFPDECWIRALSSDSGRIEIVEWRKKKSKWKKLKWLERTQ